MKCSMHTTKSEKKGKQKSLQNMLHTTQPTFKATISPPVECATDAKWAFGMLYQCEAEAVEPNDPSVLYHACCET